MAILRFRYGDAQALKPIITSLLVKNSPKLELEVLSASNGLHTESSSHPKLELQFPSGVRISDSTAMAEAFSGVVSSSDLVLYSQVHNWLEWERCILKPVVYSQDCVNRLTSVLLQLESVFGTGDQEYLIDDSLTVADVAVFATLFPLKTQEYIPGIVKAYLQRLANLKPFRKGVKKMLGGELTENSCLELLNKEIQLLAMKAPKLPVSGERNILITSALPYVNNVPHLGNIIGCVLSADCYARFCRERGFNTIFICGTDEYGTATETKAYEEGVSCEEICDKYHVIHKMIYEWFGISCDKFGRTPTRHQTKIAQEIFLALKDNNNIVENDMQQLYSSALGKFLADRFIVGTCPKCGYEDARGDQCDNCGSLLNPTELIDPKCKLTGTTPILKTTRHVFLDLPRLSDALQSYIDTTSQKGGWSSNCLQITNAWMRDGLKQRCITRDLKWGIPVPLAGYEDKVFYVWFDAPIGYISITADYTSQWEQWWKNPEEVELVQFMGKDNVPFHTVIFPSTLIGTSQSWTMMKKISVTEYLNYESGKFSKSRGSGVFGDNAMDSGIPVEVWRYYLLANRPEQQDSSFSWDNLGVQNNSELLNNLGNFINRALKFVEKFYNNIIPNSPTSTAEGLKECLEFSQQISNKINTFIEKMESVQIRSALAIVMDISATGNKFLQDHKPWDLVKQSPEKCKSIVRTGAGLVALLAALLQPFMPSISDQILHQMALDPVKGLSLRDQDLERVKDLESLLPEGHKINQPSPLFVKITEDQLDEFREKFKGKQMDSGQEKSNVKKKAKKEKAQTDEKQTAQKKAVEEDRPVDVSRLDLRVGFIEKAWKHPEADSLYIEEINIGEDENKTVVSGLVKSIPENEMQKRFVIVVCNMKPVKMRGTQSQAMLLAATSPDGTTVELLEPPKDVKVGEKVFIEGFEGVPDKVLKPKQKVFEIVQKDLSTNESCIVCYKEKPFLTSKGECTVKSITNGTVK
eukprot:g4484.t1